MTNGGTGPTVQCEARVLVAAKNSAMPSAAAEGTGDLDWNWIAYGGGYTLAIEGNSNYSTFGAATDGTIPALTTITGDYYDFATSKSNGHLEFHVLVRQNCIGHQHR